MVEVKVVDEIGEEDVEEDVAVEDGIVVMSPTVAATPVDLVLALVADKELEVPSCPLIFVPSTSFSTDDFRVLAGTREVPVPVTALWGADAG